MTCKEMQNNRPYRPNVGIMLLNNDGKIWIGTRTDILSPYWQMPQGGIDEGEDIEQAMWRELEEEISVKQHQAKIIDYSKDWLLYNLPDDLSKKMWNGKYRGQKQIWFVLRLTFDDNVIDINTQHPEFKEWKWININELVDVIVPFKKDIYQNIVDTFGHYCK